MPPPPPPPSTTHTRTQTHPHPRSVCFPQPLTPLSSFPSHRINYNVGNQIQIPAAPSARFTPNQNTQCPGIALGSTFTSDYWDYDAAKANIIAQSAAWTTLSDTAGVSFTVTANVCSLSSLVFSLALYRVLPSLISVSESPYLSD